MADASLTEIAAFCAVVAHRSFRRAADELGVTPSNVSHTINGLEKRLGVRLLHRTTRSVAATEAGEDLHARMEPLLRQFDDALTRTRQYRDTVSGSVRVSAAAPAISPLLTHVLPRLQQTHPDVHVEFGVDGRFVDIVEEGFDAGIRFGDVVPKDMVGVPFGTQSRFVAVASPGYLADRDVPQEPEDLERHRAIRMRLSSGRLQRWAFEKEGRTRIVEPSPAITLSDVPLQVEAAASGLGVAYVWEESARPLIADGRLALLLEDWCPQVSGLLLYYPNNRRVPPALRALIDTIRAAFRSA